MSIKRRTFASILTLVIVIIIGIGIVIAGSSKVRAADLHFHSTPSLHSTEHWGPAVHHSNLHNVRRLLRRSHEKVHVVTSRLSRLDVHGLS